MTDNNWIVTSLNEWFNEKTKKKESTERLLGIYPTYEEAAFIRSKISGPTEKLITIKTTTKEPTTMRVGRYLETMKQRRESK